MRHPDQNTSRGRTGFFISRSSLVSDSFFLAYGGLHWSYQEIRSLPLRLRQQFVEALERQIDFEREQMDKR
jgi:hypothetical protein